MKHIFIFCSIALLLSSCVRVKHKIQADTPSIGEVTVVSTTYESNEPSVSTQRVFDKPLPSQLTDFGISEAEAMDVISKGKSFETQSTRPNTIGWIVIIIFAIILVIIFASMGGDGFWIGMAVGDMLDD